jgi:hypothetical protein
MHPAAYAGDIAFHQRRAPSADHQEARGQSVRLYRTTTQEDNHLPSLAALGAVRWRIGGIVRSVGSHLRYGPAGATTTVHIC